MARKSQTMDPWAGLNERQQSYLKAIYQADQKAEADEKYAAASNWNSRSADKWRWLLYGYDKFGSPTPLMKNIMDLGLKDQGTGSTFEALETRKLILVKYTGALDDTPLIRITPEGRKLVRIATKEERPAKLSAGTLREWHWRALAKCYEAYKNGESGVQKDDYLRYGGLSWKTWLRLRDYRLDGQNRGLVKEYDDPKLKTSMFDEWSYVMQITEFGLVYYTTQWKRYNELYPDVNAPELEHKEGNLP